MIAIKGIPVKITTKLLSGYDDFNNPIYVEGEEIVENVIVSPVSSEDATEEFNLTGKHIVYTLCIPKGDAHKWDNTKVEFFNQKWQTVGYPKEYIEDMVPLEWNKQISVEHYEQDTI